MFKDMHRPTLILSLAIAATAIGVLRGVDRDDLRMDIAAIETPPIQIEDVPATAQTCCRAWWNVLGHAIDYLK